MNLNSLHGQNFKHHIASYILEVIQDILILEINVQLSFLEPFLINCVKTGEIVNHMSLKKQSK